MTQATQRGFSSSSTLYKNPLARRRGGDLGKHLPKYVIPQNANIPEYPYGPNLLYKQSNKGLYGGQRIQFGNNVSRKTETTTRRFWKPNVLSKGLYSVALKKKIDLRVTSQTLKTIDNDGGLDNYLLKPTESRIKELGPLGWALRWTLMQKPEIIEKMRTEAAALGLTEDEINQQWPVPTRSQAETDAAEQSVLDAVAQAAAEPPVSTRKGGLKPHEVKAIIAEAKEEWVRSMAAAKRYVRRNFADNLEQGIQMAFIRQKSRASAREQTLEKLDQMKAMDPETLASVQASKKAAREAKVASYGGREAWLAMKKEEFAQTLREAEEAQYDMNLPEEERLYYQSAFAKAQRAIETEFKKDYVTATLQAASSRPRTTVSQHDTVEETIEETNEDAWDSVLDQTTAKTSPEKTLSA